MANSILDFAENTQVRPYHSVNPIGLVALLSREDALRIAAEVRKKIGQEHSGALLSEPPRGYARRALAPHWLRLSQALDQLRVQQAQEAIQEQRQQQARKLKHLRRKYTPTLGTAKERVFSPELVADQEARKREAVRTKGSRLRGRFQNAGVGHDPQPKVHHGGPGHKHLCDCGGSCGSCALDRCEEMGHEVAKIDTLLALARNELATSAALRQMKSLLGALEGKSLDTEAPTVNEAVLRVKMLTLRDQRQETFDRWAQSGCALLRTDRASSS